MPAKSKRTQGQRDRRAREATLPPEERSELLNEYSQTRAAVAARAARPREEQWTAQQRKRRVQARAAHPRRACTKFTASGARTGLANAS